MVQLIIDYHCEEDKCSYESVLKEIIHGSKAVQLKALGVKELTTEIVTAIDRSPEIFIPSSLNGYLFQKLGKPYLLLRNNSDDGSSMKQRYGLIDVDVIRTSLMLEAKRKKDSRENAEALGIGMLVGTALIGASQLCKRIKI